MSDSLDKGLQGAALAVKAGYLILGGVAIYLVWKLFGGGKKDRIDIPLSQRPDNPDVSGNKAPPTMGEPPEGGVVLGGAARSIVGYIVDPPPNGSTSRSLFRSTFPATIELSNQSRDAQDAVIEIRANYDLIIGGTREDVSTTLGPFHLEGSQTSRFEVRIETGIPTISIGPEQANGTFRMYVDGELTSTTYFYVA